MCIEYRDWWFLVKKIKYIYYIKNTFQFHGFPHIVQLIVIQVIGSSVNYFILLVFITVIHESYLQKCWTNSGQLPHFRHIDISFISENKFNLWIFCIIFIYFTTIYNYMVDAKYVQFLHTLIYLTNTYFHTK